MIQEFIKLFFKIIGLIPQKAASKISSVLGQIAYLIDARHRNIALKNLRFVFIKEKSEQEIRKIAVKAFANLFMMLFEIGQTLNLAPKDLEKYFYIKGRENFKNALKEGRGGLILAAHFGNWELLPVVSYMLDHKIDMLYRPIDNPLLDTFVFNLRARFGSEPIAKEHSMRKVLKSLKKQHALAILIDQRVDWYEGVFVDFFGKITCTTNGLAIIARSKGSPVIPTFLIREKNSFRIEIGQALPFIKTGSKLMDIEENTRQYNKVIESFIIRYPDHWFWLHDRWKTPTSFPICYK